jgi:hypothetical protein
MGSERVQFVKYRGLQDHCKSDMYVREGSWSRQGTYYSSCRLLEHDRSRWGLWRTTAYKLFSHLNAREPLTNKNWNKTFLTGMLQKRLQHYDSSSISTHRHIYNSKSKCVVTAATFVISSSAIVSFLHCCCKDYFHISLHMLHTVPLLAILCGSEAQACLK